MKRVPIFYGWWMVAACVVIAVLSWGFGIFGVSVYLHAISQFRGWSLGVISSAVTFSFLIAAVASLWVGSAIDRFGPRPVMSGGAIAMATGLIGLGHVSEPWHVYAAFVVTSLGNACLSVTAITATLSPWFERHQGRAVSTAMLGASVGGMTGVPFLLLSIEWLGFQNAMLLAGVTLLVIVLPIAVFALRKHPHDMGLHPDGEAPQENITVAPARRWSRSEALRTMAFYSVVIAFGLGLTVQVGFLTHHVTLVAPALGAAAASAIVSVTALAAFLGRVALARYADHVDLRVTSCAVLLLAAVSLGSIAVFPVPIVLIGASVVYGLTSGNVTTLSPIIVRREFGASSFGAIYGVAWMGIGLASAFGPAFFGLLHDAFGGYGPALFIAAALDVVAAGVVLIGGRKILAA